MWNHLCRIVFLPFSPSLFLLSPSFPLVSHTSCVWTLPLVWALMVADAPDAPVSFLSFFNGKGGKAKSAPAGAKQQQHAQQLGKAAKLQQRPPKQGQQPNQRPPPQVAKPTSSNKAPEEQRGKIHASKQRTHAGALVKEGESGGGGHVSKPHRPAQPAEQACGGVRAANEVQLTTSKLRAGDTAKRRNHAAQHVAPHAARAKLAPSSDELRPAKKQRLEEDRGAASNVQKTARPFASNYLDEFETSLEAVGDIVPVLQRVCKLLGRSPGNLRVYDPFYCRGTIKKHYQAFGFQRFIHENRDFYKDVAAGTVPEHDILCTNPPYSGEELTIILRRSVNRRRRGTRLNRPTCPPTPPTMPRRVHMRIPARARMHVSSSLTLSRRLQHCPPLSSRRGPQGAGHQLLPGLWQTLGAAASKLRRQQAVLGPSHLGPAGLAAALLHHAQRPIRVPSPGRHGPRGVAVLQHLVGGVGWLREGQMQALVITHGI